LFHLTKSEILEMEWGTTGGMTNLLQKVIDSPDSASLVRYFKDIILRAYGVKSDDGRQIIKSEELSKAFSQTQAYSDLFVELTSDTEAAIAFVKAIIPDHK